MTQYTKDTRTLSAGDTYVVLKGARYDGQEFIAQALEKGACKVVSDRPYDHADQHPDVTFTIVPNVQDYLASQAREKLKDFGVKIVAITGSVGKTTTRGALVTVLSHSFQVLTPKGNLNTPVGLALTVLNELTPETEIFVAEMGAGKPGDIAELCHYFPPDLSIVTVVAESHYEYFGSLDAIAEEKGAIIRALGPQGAAILNGDDARVRAMAQRCQARAIFYGQASDNDIKPEAIEITPPLLGAPAMTSLLASYAAAKTLGMTHQQIMTGMKHVRPVAGRLNPLKAKNGATLIDDTYNAAPAAMMAALEVLETYPNASRRIALLGDMLELGDNENAQHETILKHALSYAQKVVTAGPRFRSAAQRLGVQVESYDTSLELSKIISSGAVDFPKKGDVILVKGAQGMRMERVSTALLHPSLNPEDVLVRQSFAWKAVA